MANGVGEDIESQADPFGGDFQKYRDLLLGLLGPTSAQLNPLQQAIERLRGSTAAAANQPSMLQRAGQGAGNVLSSLVSNPPAPVPGVSLEEMNQRLTTTPNAPRPHWGELVGNTLGSIINAMNREHAARITRSKESVESLQRQTIQDVAAGKYGDLTDPKTLARLQIILGEKPSFVPVTAESRERASAARDAARRQNVESVVQGRREIDIVKNLPGQYKSQFMQTMTALKAHPDPSSPEAMALRDKADDILKQGQEALTQNERRKTLDKQASQESGRIQRRETALNVVLTPEERNALKKANVGYTPEDLGGDEETLNQHEALVESANAKMNVGAEKRLAVINKQMEATDSLIARRVDSTELDFAKLRSHNFAIKNAQEFAEFKLFFQARLRENMTSAANDFKEQMLETKSEAWFKAAEKFKTTGKPHDSLTGETKAEGSNWLMDLWGAVGAMLGYSQRAKPGQPPAEISGTAVEKSIVDETYKQAIEQWREWKRLNPDADINEALKGLGERKGTKIPAQPAVPTKEPGAPPAASLTEEQKAAKERLRELGVRFD